MAKKRRISTKSKTKKGKPILILVNVLVLFSLAYLSFLAYQWQENKHQYKLPTSLHFTRTQQNAIERVEINYGKEVDKIAKEFDLPAAYIKALIVLECSGHKTIKPRFEKHVYNALKNVRDGKRRNYYNIKKRKLKNLSDAGLKNLASSWGPFQLMGYQVFNLGIHVHQIRGKDQVYWGVKWIKKRYGRRLKKKHYKDCFHIHNAGYKLPRNKVPRTHDPNYIPNGMKYIKAFELLTKKQQNTIY